MIKKNELAHEVSQMKFNAEIYVNSVNLTSYAIQLLREYIQTGVLLPNIEEASRIYSDIDSVMSGKTILPQMFYYKVGPVKLF